MFYDMAIKMMDIGFEMSGNVAPGFLSIKNSCHPFACVPPEEAKDLHWTQGRRVLCRDNGGTAALLQCPGLCEEKVSTMYVCCEGQTLTVSDLILIER